MSRALVRAELPIGPWIPGFVLPLMVGAVGCGATFVVLRGGLIAVGLLLAVVAAVRVRSPAPWLLTGLLVLGQLLVDPTRIDGELLVLVLCIHLIVVLTLHAQALPNRARVQLAALLPAARTAALVQLPAQALAVAVLLLAGRLPTVPAASMIGGALLLLVAGLLVLPRVGPQGSVDPRDPARSS